MNRSHLTVLFAAALLMSGVMDPSTVQAVVAPATNLWSNHISTFKETVGTGNYQGATGASAVAVDQDSNVLVGGYLKNVADFGKGVVHTVGASDDAYVAKYDGSSGRVIWATTLGGSGLDVLHGLAVDALGNIYAIRSRATGVRGTIST